MSDAFTHSNLPSIFKLKSINIDKRYRLRQLPCAGKASAYKGFVETLGGKGLNISAAIAKAYSAIYHIGAVNDKGERAFEWIRATGVDTELIE